MTDPNMPNDKQHADIYKKAQVVILERLQAEEHQSISTMNDSITEHLESLESESE